MHSGNFMFSNFIGWRQNAPPSARQYGPFSRYSYFFTPPERQKKVGLARTQPELGTKRNQYCKNSRNSCQLHVGKKNHPILTPYFCWAGKFPPGLGFLVGGGGSQMMSVESMAQLQKSTGLLRSTQKRLAVHVAINHPSCLFLLLLLLPNQSRALQRKGSLLGVG